MNAMNAMNAMNTPPIRIDIITTDTNSLIA